MSNNKLQNKTMSDVSFYGFYSTYDLGCASALVTAGFEILDLDRTNPRKVNFIFKRDTGIEAVADDFWSDRLEQKSRAFWDNTKNLKNRLYSGE